MGLVDAARAAKVEHYVFVSVSGNLLKHGDNPLFDAKKAVENHLRESGFTFTILRPSRFIEIWLSSHLGFDFETPKRGRFCRAMFIESGYAKCCD